MNSGAEVNTQPPHSTVPNCWFCVHFSSSWDESARYACNLHGFKSPRLPALVVRQVDGRDCLGFIRRKQ